MPINPIFNDLLKTDFSNLYSSLSIDQMRKYYVKSLDDFKGDIIEVGSVTNSTVKTSQRDTPIRIYNPKTEETHPVFVWIHGGGFIFGSIEVYDSICRKIANCVNCTVISVDYGLSPEHKFPEPIEECYQVVKWVYENAKRLNMQPDKIAVGGDSVGGTITAVITRFQEIAGSSPLYIK